MDSEFVILHLEQKTESETFATGNYKGINGFQVKSNVNDSTECGRICLTKLCGIIAVTLVT